jgi:hypothetical protein
VRIRNAIVKRQALDRIMIGFNGVKRAKTSNRTLPPLPTFTGSAVVVPSSAVVLPITQSAASSRIFCSQ